MKKKIVALMLASMMAVSATACGDSGDTSGGDNTAQEADAGSDEGSDTSDEAEDTSEDVTYQSILDDYTKQIQDATPGLVEEYNTEAADKAVYQVVELCTKI